MVGHGTEQAAVHASLLGQLHGGASELLALGLGGSQLLGGCLFQLGALGFELGLGGSRGTAGAARGDQEVAGVAVLDLDDLAQVAEVHDLVEQNDLHGSCSLDLVLVAVGQHGQETGALDRRVQLALVNGARAGQTCGNDLAVFGNEVTQGVDVLVVDFFDASDGEAAEALALEQQRLGVALRTLVLVEFLERGHFRAS
ncbi:hypothetical protein SDC9_180499 [bioreactor metagenome]|uniref:NAD-specific glutamate dehydrogenase n=1 Tax=bioreactor metagenome TaxID=1076179 RepID=A0A645H3F4_9ZZZZ